MNSIYTIFQYILSILTFYIVALNISKQKVAIIEFCISIVFAMFFIITVWMFLKNNLISSILMLILLVLFIYLKSRSLLLSILTSLISGILILTLDNLVSTFAMFFLSLPQTTLRDNWLIFLVISVIIFMSSFYISKVLGSVIHKLLLNISDDSKNKLFGYVFVILVLALVIFYFNAYLSTDKADTTFLLIINSVLLFMDFSFIVVGTYIYFKNIKSELDIKHMSEISKNLQTYINNLESMHSEIQNYRHDIKNIISSVYLYIRNDDMEGLKDYFNVNIIPINHDITNFSMVMQQLKNINIHEFRDVLTIKFLYAIEQGINISIEVFDEVNKLDINIVDLIRVTSILLDNAIEECQKSKGSYIKFALIIDGNNTRIIFVNQLIDSIEIHNIFNNSYSTKGPKRGTGLSSLRRILSKYKKITLNTYINDEKVPEFVQEVTLYS